MLKQKKSVRRSASKKPSEQTLNKALKTAVTAAEKAGQILLSHFGKKLLVEEKPGAGLVTQVDRKAEEAVIKILHRDFPSFSIYAEETYSRLTGEAAEGRWVIDPLDGTTNYIHGFPMFCVSIAAEVQGQLSVGVIYHPILNEMYTAVSKKGAFVNKTRMKVSSTSKVENSLLTTGFTYRKDQWLHMEMDAFEQLSRVARAVRRPGSAALDLAYVARGVFDGFWERRLAAWDVAAGSLLIEEAGGRVTSFSGKSIVEDFSKSFIQQGGEIVASNGKLHKSLLKQVEPKFCRIADSM